MVVILAVFSLVISQKSEGGQHSGSHISCYQFDDIAKSEGGQLCGSHISCFQFDDIHKF